MFTKRKTCKIWCCKESALFIGIPSRLCGRNCNKTVFGIIFEKVEINACFVCGKHNRSVCKVDTHCRRNRDVGWTVNCDLDGFFCKVAHLIRCREGHVVGLNVVETISVLCRNCCRFDVDRQCIVQWVNCADFAKQSIDECVKIKIFWPHNRFDCIACNCNCGFAIDVHSCSFGYGFVADEFVSDCVSACSCEINCAQICTYFASFVLINTRNTGHVICCRFLCVGDVCQFKIVNSCRYRNVICKFDNVFNRDNDICSNVCNGVCSVDTGQSNVAALHHCVFNWVARNCIDRERVIFAVNRFAFTHNSIALTCGKRNAEFEFCNRCGQSDIALNVVDCVSNDVAFRWRCSQSCFHVLHNQCAYVITRCHCNGESIIASCRNRRFARCRKAVSARQSHRVSVRCVFLHSRNGNNEIAAYRVHNVRIAGLNNRVAVYFYNHVGSVIAVCDVDLEGIIFSFFNIRRTDYGIAFTGWNRYRIRGFLVLRRCVFFVASCQTERENQHYCYNDQKCAVPFHNNLLYLICSFYIVSLHKRFIYYFTIIS